MSPDCFYKENYSNSKTKAGNARIVLFSVVVACSRAGSGGRHLQREKERQF
jgi:hypothetical protein